MAVSAGDDRLATRLEALGSLWREPDATAAELSWPALQMHDVFKIFRSGPGGDGRPARSRAAGGAR